MKIEIDTNQDSRDAIRKVVRLLHELTDESYSNYAQSQSSSLPVPSQAASSDGFFNIFGSVDQTSSLKSSPPVPSSAPSVSPSSSSQDGFFDIFKEDSSKQVSVPSPADHSGEDDRTIDEEYDDLARMVKKPAKPNVVKDSEMKSKKWQLPADQISVIEY